MTQTHNPRQPTPTMPPPPIDPNNTPNTDPCQERATHVDPYHRLQPAPKERERERERATHAIAFNQREIRQPMNLLPLTRERERERERERGEVRLRWEEGLGREIEREVSQRKEKEWMNRIILFLQLNYSTITNLGWYCSTDANFFTSRRPGIGPFWCLDPNNTNIYHLHHRVLMLLGTQNLNPTL